MCLSGGVEKVGVVLLVRARGLKREPWIWEEEEAGGGGGGDDDDDAGEGFNSLDRGNLFFFLSFGVERPEITDHTDLSTSQSPPVFLPSPPPSPSAHRDAQPNSNKTVRTSSGFHRLDRIYPRASVPGLFYQPCRRSEMSQRG